nr:glycosyltransferase [Actinomycetota bacterium]
DPVESGQDAPEQGASDPVESGQDAPEQGAFRFGAVLIGDRPRPGRDLAAVRRLRRLLTDFGPAVVHAHGLRAGALTALALPGIQVPGLRVPGLRVPGLRVPGLRAHGPLPRWPRRAPGLQTRGRRAPGGPSRRRPALVVTVHNAPPAAGPAGVIYRGLEWLVARRADVLLCVAPDLAARMRRLSARTVAQAVVAAPAGPAPGNAASDTGTPAPAPEAGQAAPVVLAVGRLAPQKGFDSLLAAAVRWQDRRPRPVLMIAGAGPLAGELAGQAARLGVTARFLGQRDDVPALLAAADVFVLPSRWEGQPMILHEALRAGRPIVATAVGGVPGMTGADAALLVPPDHPAALADAVTRILDDPALADRLSRAATARAAELPDAAGAVRSALDLYARLGVLPVR